MARNWYGKRRITKQDRYTKHHTSFTKGDEYWEYFKMFLMILAGLSYMYILYR